MLEGAEVRLAVDIGGTFTDIVLDIGCQRRTRKLLTTPTQPEQAVLDGTRLILADAKARISDIDVFIHGTTLATNAIIERRGAKTALIATSGFRDVLDIGTESRYDQYDLSIDKPKPLVPRNLRFTVPERVDAHGDVRLPLDEAAVRSLVPLLRAQNVASVAIAFLHAYANPTHERRAAEILNEEMPDVSITVSSAVCPEIREYERTSTAVANAYVQPLMDSYLARMEQALQVEQFRGAIYLVTSGGGVTSIATARRFPVRLVESGPAGGAIFAGQIAARLGERKVLSFDMGGTTAKICLIEDFEPESSRVFEVDRAARFLKGSGLPVRIPVIEMVEIGAGGGSIARIDAMKRVTVGPESASSEPGPACYGRGGQHPAVTDSDVALGMIDPDAFAGGTIKLDPELSKQALLRDVGAPLGLDAETAAYAVHEVVCENMASAARVHAVERGAVIGQHTLIAFGGAAPLHAARVAEKIGVAKVIVPSNAGVGSAVGFLAAPIAYELVRSRHARLDDFDTALISSLLQEMADEARALVEPGAALAPVRERRAAFMRYVGQGHEISVELPNRALTADDLPALRTTFEAGYAALFERPIPGAAIEVLSWSVLATTDARQPAAVAAVTRKPAGQAAGHRKFFDGRAGRFVEIPLYRREQMAPGAVIAGPAVIAEDETSTFVSNSFDAHIDGAGSIVMERKAA
ncbi:hydantoinase/oxoprolinase family protein [Bradyrhizobium sp. 83012]|uniref:Hydantoinase/oxoprolinase family protein n=1 Tax=Bradyrhizobium aeschynomenes TaxID=2734909 RepID=A0ABX2C7J5_9BRAD|nr:hydantoinase/oxoprolinase family protein [Bradyrhizobium aeschynomenes]NPU13042.1 hydantoinase/oxoprolinase family protein [Bradyrhizobium aeschynomenes]NPU63733.1 hydantoinase/oxoprolinase family protein [Bradyrhizobium aeschynomenes]NPV23366.1 hydantoinase/oxoprolinase family protein [Bradyrhizobium aeschynomenes]